MIHDDDDETGGYGSLASWLPNGRACPECKRPQDGAWLCAECSEADRKNELRKEVEQQLLTLHRAMPPALVRFALTPEGRAVVRHEKLKKAADLYNAANSLLVLGGSGIGKTLTMVQIALRLSNQLKETGNENPIRYAFWSSGLEIARALREQRLGTECAELEQARRCRLLFLDEVGQEAGDPRWLLDLLDSRYGHGFVTVASSGLRKAELEARYGIGALRRFTAPCGWTLDLFEGGAS